jgi:hypothetical protein
MNLRAILILTGFLILILNKFPKKNEETIVWQEGRLLTWDDFKGKPAQRNSVASTSYDIEHQVIFHSSSATVIIRSIFFPQLSWKRKGRNDEDILKHEQGHFDIAEIFARKLRVKARRLSCGNATELDSKLKTITEKCEEEMDKFQDTYDRETDHSRNGDAQRKWNDSLKKELDRSYASRSQAILIRFTETLNEEVGLKTRQN